VSQLSIGDEWQLGHLKKEAAFGAHPAVLALERRVAILMSMCSSYTGKLVFDLIGIPKHPHATAIQVK